MNTEEWIARQNIEHYDRLLQTTYDEQKRQSLLRLKAEAETTLARINGWSRSHDAGDRKQGSAETGEP